MRAVAFFSGVSHLILSTPGVFLPWFSVTRLTASAFALNEWVSKCCNAFTLPHFPSCVAWTIRVCSRLTFLWILRQSMACHSTSSRETAPAVCCSAVICFVSFIGSSNDLVLKDLVEVCPFSRRVMLLSLNPYLLHYRAAFAFSTFLYPHLYRLPLRVAFPFQGEVRAYRVPFTYLSGLGPPFSP